jgi:hypothetical protein
MPLVMLIMMRRNKTALEMAFTLGFAMLYPPMIIPPSRSLLTRLSQWRKKERFLRLIARGRCLSRVSHLGVMFALASASLDQSLGKEVSTSSRGTPTQDLVSIGSRLSPNSSSD